MKDEEQLKVTTTDNESMVEGLTGWCLLLNSKKKKLEN